MPRVKVERRVAQLDIDDLIEAFDERIAAGHLYGDFQFATAPDSPEFLRTGVLSSYRPRRPRRAPIPADQRRLSQHDWNELLHARARRQARGLSQFTDFYLATHGQIYWSDTHQLNLYLEDYHGALDHRLGAAVRGSEMITELYVPRARLLRVHGRRAARLPPERRRLHLRDDPADRSGAGNRAALGARELGLRDLQPAHRSPPAGHRARRRAISAG